MSDRNLDLAQKIIDLAMSLGADSADAVVGESASLNVSCRLGQLEDTERSESRELGLRAIIGQQQAFVSGTAVDAEALQRLAERAVEMAKATPADRYCGLAPPSVWQANCRTSISPMTMSQAPPNYKPWRKKPKTRHAPWRVLQIRKELGCLGRGTRRW